MRENIGAKNFDLKTSERDLFCYPFVFFVSSFVIYF